MIIRFGRDLSIFLYLSFYTSNYTLRDDNLLTKGVVPQVFVQYSLIFLFVYSLPATQPSIFSQMANGVATVE